MIRTNVESQLDEIQDDILALASMVEKAITHAIEALRERDLEASQAVVAFDDVIDEKRFAIEERCVDLLATQQPAARDLRWVIALLHIAVELERMGDYAEGIGKISLMMGDEPPLKPLIDIPRMAEMSINMLRQSIDALVTRDVDLAKRVCDADDEVDALHEQIYNELLLFMIKDPRSIQRATYLLWVTHDLERTADRATNIAERVIYLVTGKMLDLNLSKQ
ncbi:MAG: phosphate signaling complex protein PhoU [Chloroflexi bacterium]|nr:phosphate signaling complex protein PhoU [Chloroflexota bacterium]